MCELVRTVIAGRLRFLNEREPTSTLLRPPASRATLGGCPMHAKTFVIIGGTTGLGLSGARALVAAGANVVVVGRNAANAAEAVESLGSQARHLVADASDPTTASAAIALATHEFGELHGLYHVAGGSGRSHGDGPLHEVSDAGINYTLSLNLTSVIYSNRAAVKQFLAQASPGVVLNMGSVLGTFPSPTYFATHVYAATKAAIVGLTKSAAAYYATQNIRFNVLAPALVETPMAERATQNVDIVRFVERKQALDGGRVSHPSDLDGTVVYLLSDASRLVTGQVLYVDGGWSVSEGLPRESAGGA